MALASASDEKTWPYSNDPELAERFWARVEGLNEPAGCWLFTGSINRKGYGQFYWRHPETGRPRHDLAHRVAFYLFCGWLPSYLVHGCDNRACVRPTHMFNGNPFRETGLNVNKRKLPVEGRSFFSDQDAFDIRTAAASGVDEGELARRYGVGKKDIARVTLGRTFKNAGGPIRGSRHMGIKFYREQWHAQLRESVA